MNNVHFKNKRGESLAGLFYQGAGKRPRPAVVVCHGFTGSKEGKGTSLEMAKFLSQSGFSALLFDFAGCGQSEGRFEDLSLSGQIGDLKGAVDFCLDSGCGPVITMGRSFGGTTALCHAASDGRIAGVCTWAAPASLVDLFMGFTDEDLPDDEGQLVTIAGAEGIIQLKKSFFTDLSRHDVLRCASLISPRPLLVIHGTADDVVPPGEAESIQSASGEPRELRLVEGADHQFSAHQRKVWDITLQWLKKHF